MAHVGNGAAAEEEDCFEDAFDRIPSTCQMDLQTAIQETQCALNLVLNNKFSQALDLLKPWWKHSMYHALSYSSILVMQATMTFEQKDIQTAMETIKQALQTCHRFRKRNSMVGSLSSLISKQSNLQEEEMHAELCYAECLLQKATLTFIQMLSLLPQRILRLLEFIGFSGNRSFGLAQLREGASSQSLRSILCVLTLLFYNTYVSLILGTGEGNLVEAEALLEPYQEKYPKGSIILFYSARIATLRGNFEKVCSFALMICVFKGTLSIEISDHNLEPAWHGARQTKLQAIYMYQKAAILSMMTEDDVRKTGEDIVELFRQVEGLKQRLAGKSIPMEKFAVRKSRRYKAAKPVPLVIPALEMMYVWNGFTIVGKRADFTESLLVTIEKAEQQLRNDPNPSEFHPDDSGLVQMLKGLCLKHLGRFLQAELCFTQVLSSESRIRYDHYLIPFTLYELGLLYKQQGDFLKATTYIEKAKTNYKDYSMESRLHFRIHAALSSLKGSPVGTP
ncbi:PREDICTED: tetratricopeptide repeat protein 39B [Cyprinodon variegatus]|uniref:tetratricopeptide repeat protein 39B n=1 Tax=Cyprinodon variegatus TaxID=28743 RepID=UPI00074261F2|nr:PREDICTED: tetratricopeptide repeat protein 39B [Cyprinodon variegatus]